MSLAARRLLQRSARRGAAPRGVCLRRAPQHRRPGAAAARARCVRRGAARRSARGSTHTRAPGVCGVVCGGGSTAQRSAARACARQPVCQPLRGGGPASDGRPLARAAVRARSSRQPAPPAARRDQPPGGAQCAQGLWQATHRQQGEAAGRVWLRAPCVRRLRPARVAHARTAAGIAAGIAAGNCVHCGAGAGALAGAHGLRAYPLTRPPTPHGASCYTTVPPLPRA